MIRAPFLVILFTSLASAQQYSIATLAGGSPPVTPVAAATASIGDPPRVALDPAGNLYFASLYSIFKVDRAGALTRVAGTGHRGVSGDGGSALNAQIATPVGIAVDAAGNLYYSERESHLIRRIGTDGVIARYAGTSVRGYSGDGGPASSAALDTPMGLAVDAPGNLYVADTGNSVIRKIARDGTISTVAGTGGAGFSGDGGPATRAYLNGPEGVAFDVAGNMYIADTFNHRVRMVSTTGILTTFAANGYPGYGGDGGPATSATIVLPIDVGLDRNGDLFIADLGNSRIRKVSNDVITTVAGATLGLPPLGTSGQLAASVRLSGPTGIAVDPTGVIYFAEGSIGSGSGLVIGDYRVWKVGLDGTITAAAGNGYKSYAGDFATASRAQFNTPAGVAADASGNLYVADSQNHRVRRITPGGSITTIAGTGIAGFSGDGGQATKAELNNPTAVAIDAAGNLFIADTSNNRIREVFPSGFIGTVAGNGNAAFFGDGTRAINAALHAPRGIAIDAFNNLYIADTLDNRIRKVDGSGIIDTIAGRALGSGGDNGPAIQALLNTPVGVAVDAAGNLYIADQGNSSIRKVSPEGTITTVASGKDMLPQGLAVDSAGNLYYTDAAQNQLNRLGTDGKISILAGNGGCCYTGDGGSASLAQLNAPWGAVVDTAGNIYFSDSGNNAIRVVYSGSSSSFIRSVANGASNLVGPVAPGEIVVISGAGIGPSQLIQPQPASDGVLPTVLADTRVLFNGTPGAMLYAGPGQVSAAVPYGVSGSNVQVTVNNQGAVTAPFTLPLAATAPAVFTADSTGAGLALATNPDGTSNSAVHPVAPGAFVTLYATGEGRTSPAGMDGKFGSDPLPRPTAPVSVTIGGQSAFVQYAGGASGLAAGILQLNVQIPPGASAGVLEIRLQIGDAVSPPGVTIVVGAN